MRDKGQRQVGAEILARVLSCLLLVANVLPLCAQAAPRQARALAPAEEALELAKAARKVYEAKQFAAAAELWRKAFRLDPAKPDYLYGVGKAEQRAGNFSKAKAAFEQLLALLPTDDPLADRAKKALAEMAGPAATPPATPPAAPPAPPEQPPVEATESAIGANPAPPAVAAPAPATPTMPLAVAAAAPALAVAVQPGAAATNWPLWGCIGASAVGAVAAGVMAGLAMAADSDAEPFRVAGTGEFDPALISEADARSRIRTINDRWMWAGVGAGVAVASGGVAAWLGWQRSRSAHRQAPAASAAIPALSWSGPGVVLTWGWP